MELLGSPSQRNLSETQASRKHGENHSATSCFHFSDDAKHQIGSAWPCQLQCTGEEGTVRAGSLHTACPPPIPHLHAWCFILDVMGVWRQRHHSSWSIKRKSMNKTHLIMLSQGCSCQKTNRSLHFIDFHFPKVAVFSSPVFCGYGLLLYVLSGAMLSSSLA